MKSFRPIRVRQDYPVEGDRGQTETRSRIGRRLRRTARTRIEHRCARIPSRVHAAGNGALRRIQHFRNADLFRKSIWNVERKIQRFDYTFLLFRKYSTA